MNLQWKNPRFPGVEYSKIPQHYMQEDVDWVFNDSSKNELIERFIDRLIYSTNRNEDRWFIVCPALQLQSTFLSSSQVSIVLTQIFDIFRMTINCSKQQIQDVRKHLQIIRWNEKERFDYCSYKKSKNNFPEMLDYEQFTLLKDYKIKYPVFFALPIVCGLQTSRGEQFHRFEKNIQRFNNIQEYIEQCCDHIMHAPMIGLSYNSKETRKVQIARDKKFWISVAIQHLCFDEQNIELNHQFNIQFQDCLTSTGKRVQLVSRVGERDKFLEKERKRLFIQSKN